MDDAAIAFLEKNHQAAMTTLRRDGTPHSVRIGVAMVEGKIWSSSTKDRVRTKHLRRDPRSTLFVFDSGFAYLGLECRVTILDGPDVPDQSVRLFEVMQRDLPGYTPGTLNWYGKSTTIDDFKKLMIDEGRIIYEFDVQKAYGLYAGTFTMTTPDDRRLTTSPQPKAIFFDMDGTILDWTTGMEESWLESCEKHHVAGWPHTPADLHAAIRTRRLWFWEDHDRATRGRMDLDGASREIVRTAFDDLGLEHEDIARNVADFYRALRAERIVPYEGAIETLAHFQQRGIPMALLTNGEAHNQRRSVMTHQLEQYFHCIVIEGEFGCGKPDERVFRHALSEVACEPADVWMVGDSLEADIAPAVALGMHAVLVDETGEGLSVSAVAKPHRIVRVISELMPD